MKLIITESQYKKLTEGHSKDFKSYLEAKYPNISNLQMRRSRSARGVVRKYYDPETDKVFFYVNDIKEKGWESNIGTVNKNPYVRLFVNVYVYSYAKKFSYNFEYELMNWFNSTYGEETNSVIKGDNNL
jgi:hypothetical protein